MSLDSHHGWSSVHQNTSVQLPDVATWELSQRTYSWVNILWLQEKVVSKLQASQRKSPHLNMDLEESYYAKAKFRSLPDPTRGDLQRACRSLGGSVGFGAGDSFGGLRPVVYYNSRQTAADQQRKPEDGLSFWLNDDGYSGKLERVQREQVQEWLGGTGVVYVYECNSAGKFLEDCGVKDGCFHLAACSDGETLPCDDLFSCVMSAPVKTAYQWHCDQTKRKNAAGKLIPGQLYDRQMLMGQLDWILTLITDAIARESLPREVFDELFRGDLLTATLLRRFTLSQRIMKRVGCNPVSKPALPDCSQHRLWSLWDHLMDITATLLEVQSEKKCPLVAKFFRIVLENPNQEHAHLLVPALTLTKKCPKALDVLNVSWVKLADDLRLQECILNQAIVLLQSKDNGVRKKAIEFLAKIIPRKPAVEQLLKSDEDVNLCVNLQEEPCHGLIAQTMFLQLLFERNSTASSSNHKQALTAVCTELMSHSEAEVRMWSVLLGAKLSGEHSAGLRNRLEDLLSDPVPKVRAAALEGWISCYDQKSDQNDALITRLLSMINTNSNSFLRQELVHSLNVMAADRVQELIAVCKQESSTKQQPEPSKSKCKAKAKQQQKKGSQPTKSDSAVGRAWRVMVALQVDPDQEVAAAMQSVVAFVRHRVTELEAAGRKKTKKAASACKDEPGFPLPARKPLYERLCRDLPDITDGKKEVKGVNDDSKENYSGLLNGASVVPRNPTLALLNHQLRCFQTQKVPEMVRLGSNRQMATVFKDHITWQDYSGDETHTLKLPSTPGITAPVRVTSLLLDTPQRSSSLLVGYNDGSVRMWQSDPQSIPKLTSAWQALYDCAATPSSKTYGISMTSIGGGTHQLIIGGESKYLRKWDLKKEQSLGDVHIGTDQAVTVLASNGSYNVAAGLENGTVRLFDMRAEVGGKVAVGPKHGKPVRAVSLRPDDLTMVSVCCEGSVLLVDLRKMIPAVKKWTVDTIPVDVAIHEQLDLMAFAGDASLELYSIDGERICGKEGAGVVVGFHPSEAVLGTWYPQDSTVVLYGEREL